MTARIDAFVPSTRIVERCRLGPNIALECFVSKCLVPNTMMYR